VWSPRKGVDLTAWPFTIPSVRQLVDERGFEVDPGVTILIGENGSGKSTLVEAFAQVYPRRLGTGHQLTPSAPAEGAKW